MKTFRHQANRQQVALLPASIDEYVSDDDIVRYVDAMIDELDLSEIVRQYSSFGRPGFHPEVLVKIILYGKMRGIRSSRELSRACHENLRFMFLSNHEKPDFRTILLFRKRFHKELGSLLKQTIGIGLREKLITLEHVSIDGTKLRSFAGRNSFKKKSHLEEDLQELEKEILASLKNDIKNDDEDKSKGTKDTLSKDLKKKEVLVGKIKAALKQYEIPRQTQPKRVSTTDPESRYMKGKGILPSYNGQIAVDRDSDMVVGGFISTDCTDSKLLKPMLNEVETNTGKNAKIITADSGYGEIEGLVDLKKRQIDGYIPRINVEKNHYTYRDFKYNREEDSYKCPAGKTLKLKETTKRHKIYTTKECGECLQRENCIRVPHKSRNRLLTVSKHQNLVNEMRTKTESTTGKRMMKIRGATVEHVFGVLKYSKNLKRLCFRGLKMVDSMWNLELAAYNIEKLARHQKFHSATS